MQGQSSPVQVKDPYTGSILMHVGSSCKTHRSVQCTPPKNNQKLIDGSNRKTKQKQIERRSQANLDTLSSDISAVENSQGGHSSP